MIFENGKYKQGIEILDWKNNIHTIIKTTYFAFLYKVFICDVQRDMRPGWKIIIIGRAYSFV